MEKFKGTPAPWFMEEMDGMTWVTPQDRNEPVICDVVARQYVENVDKKEFEPCLQDEDLANAHLIAAAPELLEALQDITELFKRVDPLYSGDKLRIEKAEKAIQKALNIQP